MDSTGSSISPPPWHPVVPVPTHHHHQAAVLFDRDLAEPSSSPSHSPPTPTPPPRKNQHRLRPGGAARRASSRRRRTRPSRKAPTTYIAADPASFRRMVHQVTGAHDLPPQHEAATLCRPAPTRAAAARGAVPTLDTSALLLGAPRTTTGPAAPVRPPASEVGLGAGGGVVGAGLGGGGFPTLESWDALLH